MFLIFFKYIILTYEVIDLFWCQLLCLFANLSIKKVLEKS